MFDATDNLKELIKFLTLFNVFSPSLDALIWRVIYLYFSSHLMGFF